MVASLSLQTGVVKETLSEKLSTIHDTATGELTDACAKHHDWLYPPYIPVSPIYKGVYVESSDSTRESLEEFKCPFSRDEIASLREEMEELTAWDDRYFARREELLREIEEIVQGVVQTGTFTSTENIDCRCGGIFCCCERCDEGSSG